MELKLDYLKINSAVNLPEAVIEKYNFDKIYIYNKSMFFQISGEMEMEKDFSYPSILLEVMIVGIKNSTHLNLGYYPKIAIFQPMANKIVEITSLAERYTKEDIEIYFMEKKEEINKIKNIDIQFITPEDAMLKFQSKYMEIGLELFDKEKNVKQG